MTSLFMELPTEELFNVQWLLPTKLTKDPDLNDEQAAANHEVFYSDNLIVKVACMGHTFEVARRFLICKHTSGLDIHVEEGWDWNEHGDLSTDEQDLFEFIIKKCPKLFVPSEIFKEKLSAIL